MIYSSHPAKYRISALIDLVNANVPFIEARDIDRNRRILMLWNQLIGKHWMPMIHYLELRKEELLEPTIQAIRMPMTRIELMLAFVADKWIIPPGMTIVQSSFGKSDHVPEFLSVFNMPPSFSMFPQPVASEKSKTGGPVS